jgi:hypothetical protein
MKEKAGEVKSVKDKITNEYSSSRILNGYYTNNIRSKKYIIIHKKNVSMHMS